MWNQPSAEKEPEQAPSNPGTPANQGQGATLDKSQAISLCALGILICFFLPWTQVLGRSISGFDLQKLGGNQMLLWLIPISCVITIIAGLAKQSQKRIAEFAGALPFAAFAYYAHLLSFDVVKNILGIGAYGGLGLGLVLIILTFKSK